MGPAAVDTLNADRSGLHETKTIQRDRKGHPCPRTRPSGRAKEADLARALIISALPGILSHSSQDRNASPRKAGGAVNIKQSKEQQRKTGRPGPAVRDFGKIDLHNSEFELRGVSKHGMRSEIGRAATLTT